jgi:adenosylhomocysteine nucleosidase
VLVLVTGVGKHSAGAAVNWVLGSPLLDNIAYRPRCILAAGFSGALTPTRKVGDIILATEVADCSGRAWPATWPEELPAGEWRPQLHRGRVLTADSLVGDPPIKESLGRQHSALAVDMESAVVAESCARHKAPFGCVRAVSDDVATALSPQLLTVLSGGRAAPLRTLLAVASFPRLLGEMRQLARQTGVAADQLGKALGELLTLTLPWGHGL